MGRSEIAMVINLRQNKNDDSSAYGKYFAEVDSKEPENTKGEELTSSALNKECVFEFGYLVESEVRTVAGKEKRFQKKAPLSYVLAPTADNGGGGQG